MIEESGPATSHEPLTPEAYEEIIDRVVERAEAAEKSLEDAAVAHGETARRAMQAEEQALKRYDALQSRYEALLVDLQARYDALLEEAAGLARALTEVLLPLGSDNPLPRMPGDPGPTYCPCCDSTSAHWVTCPTAKARDVLANLSPALRAKMEETDGAVS